jgi:HEPN domain-containing protein
MKIIDLQQITDGAFASHREKLVSAIVELVKPDFIFLLGASVCERRMESIFSSPEPPSQYLSDCFLLIVMQDLVNKEQYEWQEKIERHCQKVAPITTIVLQSSTFEEWLKAGHRFAVRVWQSAPRIYDAGNICEPSTVGVTTASNRQDAEARYKAGLNNAQEFLAGAELFRIRKQNSMAAFMLHQSMEQALKAMLETGTGYHASTHNVRRLLQYSTFVTTRVLCAFTLKDEKENRLFYLLQTSYADARYKEEYKISAFEIICLIEKVRYIHRILSDVWKATQGQQSYDRQNE